MEFLIPVLMLKKQQKNDAIYEEISEFEGLESDTDSLSESALDLALLRF